MAQRFNLRKSPRVQKAQRLAEYCFYSAIVLLAVTFVIIILSVAHDRHNSFSKAAWNAVREHWQSLGFLVLGMIAGVGMSELAVRKGSKELTNHLWVPLKDGISYLIAGVVVCSVIGTWMLFGWLRYGKEVGFLQLFQHDQGGLFALFMAFLTVIGFALTLQGLSEIRRTITSFPDLVDRLRKMLQSVTKDGDEPVRMLCYTPSLGYIALPEREFNTFAAALKERRENDRPKAEIICLGRSELEQWHRLFIGRQTRRKQIDSEDQPAGVSVPQKSGEVTRLTADAATIRGESIVESLKSRADSSDSVKRLPFELMPGCYFFFTNDQAIVAAPLYLPFARGTPRAIQKGLPPVADMIGFQTNDRGMINDLRLLYEFYQRLPSTFVAEKAEPVTASDFETWAVGDHIKSIMQELIEQFRVARGKKARAAMTEDEKLKADSYDDYLSNDDWLKDTKLEILFRVMLVEEAPVEKRVDPELLKKP